MPSPFSGFSLLHPNPFIFPTRGCLSPSRNSCCRGCGNWNNRGLQYFAVIGITVDREQGSERCSSAVMNMKYWWKGKTNKGNCTFFHWPLMDPSTYDCSRLESTYVAKTGTIIWKHWPHYTSPRFRQTGSISRFLMSYQAMHIQWWPQSRTNLSQIQHR